MKRNDVTEEMANAWREMRNAGMSNHQIGRLFGADHRVISFHITGQRKTPYPHDARTTSQILRNAADCLEALSNQQPIKNT